MRKSAEQRLELQKSFPPSTRGKNLPGEPKRAAKRLAELFPTTP
jgi:hypothetical protein